MKCNMNVDRQIKTVKIIQLEVDLKTEKAFHLMKRMINPTVFSYFESY